MIHTTRRRLSTDTKDGRSQLPRRRPASAQGPEREHGGRPRRRRSAAVAAFVLVTGVIAGGALAPAALANGTEPRFDLGDPAGGPFPSNRFTVPDESQITGLRVELPKPDCNDHPSDCDDFDVLNTLDGFNLQPRLSIPFTGPIDLDTVSSQTVFLCKLQGAVCPGGNNIGINQVVWDPEENALHAESDQFLDQHASYLLVVTTDITDPGGDRIDPDQFQEALHSGSAYTDELLAAVRSLKDAPGIPPGHVGAASIFTTESVTAVMEKIRDQLAAATPAPADFLLGTSGEPGLPPQRTVFPFTDVASIAFRRQLTTAPTFQTVSLDLSADGLNVIEGAVGTIAFGSYRSPDYVDETRGGVIPPVGTRTGTPAVQGTNEVYFNLFLPSGPEPDDGWPVVIAGHGSGGGGKNTGNVPEAIAAKLAQHGLATIAINAVGTIAFGSYRSPDYVDETRGGVIPPVGTRTGTPAVQGTNQVYFNLFLPSGPEPDDGWPVVIAGHGSGGGGKNTGNVPEAIAAKLAQHGLATIAINAVGTGFGPEGKLIVTKTDTSTVTLPGGGRNIDRNGNGVFDHPAGSIPEGIYTKPGGPQAIVLIRDGLRQTDADLMQLVREIEVGMDVDGDLARDLDASRIYYLGNSLGGMFGTGFVALDPDVGASELGVAGGPMVEIARLNAVGPFRGLLGQLLSSRDPSLVNGGPDPINPNPQQNPFPFRENLPLRNQPPVVNDVPGAIAIQEAVERIEWAGQSGDPVAYAPHLRKAPLAGVPAKPVLYTFAQGDRVLPNTTTATLLRAGALADRTTFFRARDAYSSMTPPITPNAAVVHEFLVNLTGAGGAARPFALAAQEAVATFLASDGLVTVNPGGGVGQWFQTPIVLPLPGELP
jgi:hypothetical protein